MRKKRNDKLNVTQLFVLNHSSCPKLLQNTSGSSFSQAVAGFTTDSDGSKTAWPELTSTIQFSKYRSKKNENRPFKENVQLSQSDRYVPVTLLPQSESDLNSALTLEKKRHVDDGSNSQFPSLDGSMKTKNQKSNSQFVQPNTTCGETTLLQARRIPLKGVKVKRNDPLNIDIEAAIEVSRARQKKELKRLDQKRPRVLSCNCGNALDSANPLRKKGKVRLNKKKKLTTLRKTIERMKLIPSEEKDILSVLCKQFDGVSLSKDNLEKILKAKIHNSKFREYCKNFATRELVDTVKEFLVTIRTFQDRMFKSNEIKARARRRYAVGFHECCKLLKANSFKVIIIATNIDRNEALLNKINEVMTESMRQGIPVIFAGTCTDLSYWLLKKNRTCVVGIMNFDGANDIYARMMDLFERDKVAYELKLCEIIETKWMSTDEVETFRTNMLEKLRAN